MRFFKTQFNLKNSAFNSQFYKRSNKGLIQFMTDVEGDLQFFKKQIRESQVVQFTDQSETSLQFKSTNPTFHFVFGGDVCDRGNDIEITSMLTKLKKANKERVTLLLGNRDLNKVRFTNELPLDPNEALNQPINTVFKPPFATKSYAEFLSHRQDTPTERLKWILAFTMGAPSAFEYRRNELSKLTGQSSISDEVVYQSFRHSVEPNGFMRDYLTHAQLGSIIGDTLFLHGGITESNCGYAPNGFTAFDKKHSELRYYDDPFHWINALNNWYQSGLQRWIDNPVNTEKAYCYSDSAASAPLQHMAFGAGSIYQGKSVITGSFLKKRGIPSPMSPKVATYLQNYGINRIMSGHKPCGDTPLFLLGTTKSITPDAIQVFTCDTLYGNRDTNNAKSDSRGSSYATVHIAFDNALKKSNVTITGSTGLNEKYQRKISFPQEPKADKFFGRVLLINEIPHTVRLNPSTNSQESYTLSFASESGRLKYKTISTEALSALADSGAFLSPLETVTNAMPCP